MNEAHQALLLALGTFGGIVALIAGIAWLLDLAEGKRGNVKHNVPITRSTKHKTTEQNDQKRTSKAR